VNSKDMEGDDSGLPGILLERLHNANINICQ